MNNLKGNIDELIKKLDYMVQEEKPKEETEKIIDELRSLLAEYLKE